MAPTARAANGAIARDRRAPSTLIRATRGNARRSSSPQRSGGPRRRSRSGRGGPLDTDPKSALSSTPSPREQASPSQQPDSCVGTHAAQAVAVVERTEPRTFLARRSLYTPDMCRNIQQLRGAEPPATEAEIRDAALQFVRKVSGYRKPSAANTAAFETAVDEVALAVRRLLDGLTTGPGARPVVPLQRRRAAATGGTPSGHGRPGRE